MAWWDRLKRTLRGGGHSAEIDEELQFHLQMDMAQGHGAGEARRRLGNVGMIEEDTRAVGVVVWLDSVLRDVRYGLRQMRKAPGLAAAVICSLAVGIGANTAIFSLMDAAILRPLPVRDPNSLRIVQWTNEGFPRGVENVNGEVRPVSGKRLLGSSVSAGIYRTLARAQAGFGALIGVADPDTAAVAIDAAPAEQVNIQWVSGNFFQALGAIPAVGRTFAADEDREGHEPVVVVSDRFWKSRLGGSNEILGRSVRINNVPVRIVGVAPPSFFGLRAGEWNDIYAPLAMRALLRPHVSHATQLGESDWWVRMIARVDLAIPESQAVASLAGTFRNLVEPGANVTGAPLDLTISPGRHGFNGVNAKDRQALRILMALVGVLLLIVCANAANLLLGRSLHRQRESAVRMALGASRGRLLRQYLIEVGVLSSLGGVAGAGLGLLLAQVIHRLFQTGRDAASAFDLRPDLRMLAYTAALSALAALLFGLAPAVQFGRSSLNSALKEFSKSVTGGGMRLQRALVSLEFALCLTGLAAAGTLGRSLASLQAVDLGFERRNLAYLSLSPTRAGYPKDSLGPYADRVRDALVKIPGVIRVSAVAFRPLSGMGNNGRVNLAGLAWDDSHRTNMNSAGVGFFETAGIPLLAGRGFEARDMRPKPGTAIVDEAFATRYFPNQNPLGRRFGMDPTNPQTYEIVGVVGNSRYNNLRDGPYPTVYEPYQPGETIRFAVRTSSDPVRFAESIRRAAAAVDPAVPAIEFRTQSQLIDRMLRTERLLAFVSSAFGLAALLLSAIGLGGLLAYLVARRTREIGVRMALGAGATDILRLVLRDSLWMVGGGIALGVPGIYAAGKVIGNTQTWDAGTVAVSIATLVAVAIVAGWAPALRAARIDPVTTLRDG